MTHTIEGVLRPSALILYNEGFLVARHKEEKWFCLPGGKLMDGEAVETALTREVGEETGLVVGKLALLQRLDGIHPTKGWYLDIPLYLAETYIGEPEALGEIAELDVVCKANYRRYQQELAASTVSSHIIPGMVAGGWQEYVPQAQLVG